MDKELLKILVAMNYNLYTIAQSLEKLVEETQEIEEWEEDSDGNRG